MNPFPENEFSPEERLLIEEALGHRLSSSTSTPKEDNISAETSASSESRPTIPGTEEGSLCPSSSSTTTDESKYTTLAESFPNAAEFLMYFDSALRKGTKTLYPWQIEELIRLSDKEKWKTDNRLLYFLLANNGSGKDCYIIAGFVCYVLCCWRRYKIVITSSSDNQLNTQTRVYIKDLAENVNIYFRQVWGWEVDAIKIKAESFRAAEGFSGTEVYTFVSKVGGTVEGYHPFSDADPKEGVIIIINEGKSIPEEIHRHLKKCTYNYWIEVSSAGEASGFFYKGVTNATKYPQKPQPFVPFCRTITYKDTPHKTREAEEEIKELGIDHPFIKNTYLSKFSSVGQQVAITEESLDKCVESCNTKIVAGLGRHGGVDFAAGGGDECSFYVFDENVLLAYESWRVRDTEVTIDMLVGDADTQGLFQKYGLLEPEKINGDDNGLGEAIINSMARRKINPKDPKSKTWSINRVKNQQSARRKDRFLNRGAELYSNFSMLVAKGLINWNGKMHPKLHRQLTGRHYTIEGQAKYKLVPKEEEAESPDHADAVVLAFNNITIHDFLDKDVKPAGPRTPAPLITSAELVKLMYHRNTKYQIEGAVGGNKPKGTGFTKLRNPITLIRSMYD